MLCLRIKQCNTDATTFIDTSHASLVNEFFDYHYKKQWITDGTKLLINADGIVYQEHAKYYQQKSICKLAHQKICVRVLTDCQRIFTDNFQSHR